MKASIKRVTEKSLALAHFLLTRTSLEIDSARGSTRSGGKVEMDERRLDGDESTKLFRATKGGERGRRACLNDLDLDLRDVRFHIMDAFLLRRPGVGVARGDTVFEDGPHVVVKVG